MRISWLTWARKSVFAALAASAASRAATRRPSASRSRLDVPNQRAIGKGFRRSDPRQRQLEPERSAVAVAADDREGRLRFGGSVSPRLRRSSRAVGFGMALRSQQHQNALADDLALFVAEQPLGGPVERHDASRGVENHCAVGREIEHVLKVGRRLGRGRRLAARRLGCASALGFRRRPQRKQRGRRAVPEHHLGVPFDRERGPVGFHDRKAARVLGGDRLRVVAAEHHRQGVGRLERARRRDSPGDRASVRLR